MKVLLYHLAFLIIIFSNVEAQKISIKSKPSSFNITFKMMADSIPPSLSILLPTLNPIDSLPIYTRDSIVRVVGDVHDDKKVQGFTMNNHPVEYNETGKFDYDAVIHNGMNQLEFVVTDRRGNATKEVLRIFQDSTVDVLPPLVVLSEPAVSRGFQILELPPATDSLIVRGKITDESPVVGFWINDTEVSVGDSGLFEICLKPIPTKLYMKSIDKFGNVADNSFPIVLNNINVIDSLKAIRYHALVIAVEKYTDKEIPNLLNPINDAGKLIKTLTNMYSFEPEDVTFLKNPTRAQIIDAFTHLESTMNQNDNLLIFYAGHGMYEEKKEQGYWLPSDSRKNNVSEWISNGDIRDHIKAIDTRHTLLITDACFSGGLILNRSAYSNAPASIIKVCISKSRKAMTSGRLEPVADNSPFIGFLLKRLENNSANYMPADQLFFELRDAVSNSGKQAPLFDVIRGTGDEGLGGQFVFLKKEPTPEKRKVSSQTQEKKHKP
jgi:hypothetical protein